MYDGERQRSPSGCGPGLWRVSKEVSTCLQRGRGNEAIHFNIWRKWVKLLTAANCTMRSRDACKQSEGRLRRASKRNLKSKPVAK